MKVKLLVSGVLLAIAVLAISSVNAQDISVEKSQAALTANSSAVDLNCGSKGCAKEEKAECTKEKKAECTKEKKAKCTKEKVCEKKEKACEKSKSCEKAKKSCGGKKACGGAK